jgi:class 3 adenylate cyclase
VGDGPGESLGYRISDVDRNAVIAQLRDHTALGRLTLEEFDARVAEVYAARSSAELRQTLRELPVGPAAEDDIHHQYRVQVRERIAKWVAVNGICTGIWVATGGLDLGARSFWPFWPLIFTTVGLIAMLIRGAEGESARQRQEEAKEPQSAPVGPEPREVLPSPPASRVLATVLYVDVVDSTRRASELGDQRWRDLLDRYDAAVADCVSASHGRVVKMIGDGVLATFDAPAEAVRCGASVRREVETLGLDVRAGAHTGEVELRGDDLAGIAVHIGQRISALAAPGEVLVSRTVTELVAGSGLRFADRGEHELKGVPGRWTLFALA